MSTAAHRSRGIIVESVVCFAVLSILLLVVFSQAVFELAAGGTPGMFDIKHYYVPMGFLLDTALRMGELPQWNPLTFCGAPFAANPQSATFYPPNFVRSIATPNTTPLNTYYGLLFLGALQTVVAGVGTYWLARSHRLGYAASLAAAVTFVFSAAYTRRLCELHFVPALVWLPFIWIAFRQLLNAPNRSGRLFWMTGSGMMLAWSVLTGFLHLQVYVAILLAGYWMMYRLIDPAGRPQTSLVSRLGSDAVYGLGVVCIALAMAAAMLVPAAEFAQHTYRAGTGQARIFEYGLNWAEIRAGLFGGGTSETPSPYRAAMLSAYVLGFIALLGSRRREAIVYLLLFGALLDCSLGPPFPLASIVSAVNPFQIAHPDRVLVLCCLPLGVAAGFGVQSIFAAVSGGGTRLLKAIIISGVCAIFVWLSGLPLLSAVTGLIAAIGTFAILTMWRPMGQGAGAIACAALLIETVLVNHRYLPETLSQTGFVDIPDERVEVDGLFAANARKCDLSPNSHLYRLQPAINGYDPLYLGSVWRLLAPWQFNWNYQRILQADHAVHDNPYPYLFIKRPFWLVREYVRGQIPKEKPLFAPTTIAFVEADGALALPEVSFDEAVGELVSHPFPTARPLESPRQMDRLPLQDPAKTGAWEFALPERGRTHAALRLHCEVFCPGTIRILLDEAGTLDALPIYVTAPDEDRLGPRRLDVPLPDAAGSANIRIVWESKEEDCAPEWGPAELLIDGDDEDALIHIMDRSFNSVRVEIAHRDGPRLLAFIDANYPGWAVSVDGRPATLLTLNSAFKGVELDTDAEVVDFRFESGSLKRGMRISIAAAAAIFIALVAAIYRRRSS